MPKQIPRAILLLMLTALFVAVPSTVASPRATSPNMEVTHAQAGY